MRSVIATQMMMMSATYAPTDPYFSNVVLLLHLNGTNGSTSIIDVTGKSCAANGATAISTAQSKYGGASALIGTTGGSGVSNNITTPPNTDFDYGTADFTIEWWGYYTTMANPQTAYNRGYTAPNGLVLQTNADGKFFIYVDQAIRMTEPSAYTINTWQHHALVKDSGVLRKYRDGVQTVSVSNSSSINSIDYCDIGGAISYGYPTTGYVDDVRITKGVCRYPSGTTFTPPTAAFPDS